MFTGFKKSLAAFCLAWITTPLLAVSVYETQAEFLDRAFAGKPPQPAVIWLSGDKKSTVRELLGHDYPALRLRYWCKVTRSAWVLEEIGKELPITVGVIVEGEAIRDLRVLTYRENRGGEVSMPAFTDQFNGVSLAEDGVLNTKIDSISGATLSVQALTRLATMSLYLHAQTGCNSGT
jgi:metallophosphoesterase superfamily enzyme